VLFADVQGSMELAGQMDAEAWSKIMQRFFAILGDAVERFEGFVDKFTGDGIMALFGAPIAHEDHAQRACYAALAMREELARYANEVRREHGVVFSTRIGLNSGEVVVGAIGDDLRMEYTAQGQTVGLAQRMEALADANSCFLSASTASLVRGYFMLDDLGEMQVKGIANPVRVHRLSGIGSSKSHFDISLSRGLSRFVGRTADLRILEDALTAADAGQGQVVGIVAEAGTGKSRLCFEFAEHCRGRGVRVFEAHAVAHGRNIPFLPVIELFRALLGVTNADTEQGAREKIAGRLMVLDQRLAENVPLLFDFLGVGDPNRRATTLDADARQRLIAMVLRRLVEHSVEQTTTAIVIEDLHWLDSASAELLAQVIEPRSGKGPLYVLNFRPEFRADWMSQSWYRQIALAPLGREAIAGVLADMLGSDPSLASLTDLIFVRAAGNPFFTEEVAHTLIESGALSGTRGDYRLATPIERLELPATVQALLAARIDRLAEREKRLLQTAAVIGKDFSEPLLAELSGLAADDLRAALAGLQRSEFIQEKTLYPVAEYTFRHPLTQEVALTGQLKERRRRTHRAVAEALERSQGERAEENAALLAHHWEEAGASGNAAHWHGRAAERVELTDLASGFRHWQRVRELLRDVDEDADTLRLGIAARIQLLNLGWALAMRRKEANAVFEEGQALADRAADSRARLKLSMLHGRCVMQTNTPEYLAQAEENLQAALRIDDIALQANAWYLKMDALATANNRTVVLPMAEEGLARFPRHTPRAYWLTGLEPYTLFSWHRSVSLMRMGRLSEGIAELERCRSFAEEDQTPQPVGYIFCEAAETYHRANDPDRALQCARQAAEIAARMGRPPNMQQVEARASASALLAAGRFAETIDLAQRYLANKPFLGPVDVFLSEALLGGNDTRAALDIAHRVVTTLHRALYYAAIGWGVIARALMRQDGLKERGAIASALANASSAIEQSSSYLLSPHLLEWRAEFAALAGETGDQRQLLAEAEAGYATMGAPLQVSRIAALRKEIA
jgi:class 3 adenylate cyclase